MKKGDVASGFEILDTVDLEELKAVGIWARHKSGAEVFHILNDDPENLFGFAFSTAPEDSTGVAHILEHSVLCGSKNYPLKDAFLVLAQGSLQTFLNAWTFPDKTVYPASSVNEKDYFNLMGVYADAVFRPLLSEWTFLQEGWRLTPSKAGLEYTGVVYNEMKGAYSSMDTYAGHWSVKGIMPGTPYAFESGGDPDCIPALTWEGLKDFHRARYAPANCRIFLAGNIPTEKQLEFLDAKCLAGLESGKAAPPIPKTKRWTEPAVLRIPCPGNNEEKPQAMISWLCTDITDTMETSAISCLTEILLGHDGSPLTRALVESGLGEDLSPSTGIETELREMTFTAGLRGIKKEGAEETYKRMEELIMGELRRLVKEGIPKKEIEAALLSIEFSNREIRRSHGPFSLVWMRRSLRTWLHGARPWESLLFEPVFRELKRRSSEDRYFESLIEKHLLNNPHRALIAIEGEADYLPKKEAQLAASLKEKEKNLSKAEKKQLKEKSAQLEKIQTGTETKAALESIPHLSRQDLVPELEIVPTELSCLDNAPSGSQAVPCVTNPLFTNGITYTHLAFPVDILQPEDYPWLPFFSYTVVSVGLPGMDYGEVSSLLSRTVGGFHAMLSTFSAVSQNGNNAALPEHLMGRDWITYYIKSLDEKTDAALDLAWQLITEANFSDLRRLRDLAAEYKNDGDSSLAPNGHNYASWRSHKFFSRSCAIEDLWNGLGQIGFSHRLASMDMEELCDRMVRIRDSLLKGGLLVHITSNSPGKALKAAKKFGSLGGARTANPECRKKEAFFSLLQDNQIKDNLVKDKQLQNKNESAEVYASPSLQVGFAAMSLPAAALGSPEQAAELVFSHELSTGALWESIRMQGGAYGAHADISDLERLFSFSTYRDPDPLRSLGSFPAILKKRGATKIDEDSLEKVIIGTFAKLAQPRPPAAKGLTEFIRRLCGVTEEHRLSRLKHIVALTAEDSGKAATRLAAAAEHGQTYPVIIAGTKTAEKAAKKLGVEPKLLPV